jgi:uncharacterized protein
MHGPIGRELLEKEGFPKHALVCERHTGVGMTKEDIIKGKLPLPARDMLPETIEEKIICFADNFFSKRSKEIVKVNTVEEIKEELAKYGKWKVRKFEKWLVKFKEKV